MTMPNDLLLIRHGQSEGNAAKRRSEAGDHSAYTREWRLRHTSQYRLTEKGREQARQAGEWLRANGFAKFDRYMVSDYIRAMETAGNLGLPNARWKRDQFLHERDWGDIHGSSEQERLDKFAEEIQKRDSEPFFWKPPNGESISDLCDRLRNPLDTLHRGKAQKAVIVCHGEVIRAMRFPLERIQQEEFRRYILSEADDDKVFNCQITHYTRRDPETEHLLDHYGWVRIIRPTQSPAYAGPWKKIERKEYSNEDLLEIAAQVPSLVS